MESVTWRTVQVMERALGGRRLPRVPDHAARHRKGRCSTTTPDARRPTEAQAVRGRTQWDAMTEVTNQGKWNATRMALLIFVRHTPRSAAGVVLAEAALRLIEAFGHHR